MAQFKVIQALRAHAEAEKAKALTSFELLTDKAVGIGDHSTEDYFKNAFEALDQLAKAEEYTEILDRFLKNLLISITK